MATEKFQELCDKFQELVDDFLFYLLDERDEEHIILTNIYREDWIDENDRELWVNDILLQFLGNGLDYVDGQQYIPGYDIRNWGEKLRALMGQLTKEEYQNEIDVLYDSLRFWRIETDGFYNSLIFNYCYRFVYDRPHTDLIDILKKLYENRNIMPK